MSCVNQVFISHPYSEFGPCCHEQFIHDPQSLKFPKLPACSTIGALLKLTLTKVQPPSRFLCTDQMPYLRREFDSNPDHDSFDLKHKIVRLFTFLATSEAVVA